MSGNEKPIADFALIGNCETAALINGEGVVEWMCTPAFDGPSIFGSLLDQTRGGRFLIQPVTYDRVERAYVGETAILRTLFHTATGRLELIDFFVTARKPGSHFYDYSDLYPTRRLVRRFRALDGPVPVRVLVAARLDYGRALPEWKAVENTQGTWTIPCAHVHASLPLKEGQGDLSGEVVCRPEGPGHVVYNYTGEAQEPTAEEIDTWQTVTNAFWEEWDRFNYYGGEWRDLVHRSAVTLKLLTYSPTGGFVAAPTTSLPERVGGPDNWDYRFNWIRDTSLFINTLFRIGYSGEAQNFYQFVTDKLLANFEEQGGPRIGVLQAIRPETEIEEEFLEHLSGYRGSRPVRIGNRAGWQFQADNYAYMLQSLCHFRMVGGTLSEREWSLVDQLIIGVQHYWKVPDNGIWEMPTEASFTYGKLMCWLGLQHACMLRPEREQELQKLAAEIQGTVMARALRQGPDGPYLASTFEDDSVDASLLLALPNGFVSREIGTNTRKKIEADLAIGPWVYRNVFKRQREGVFLLASFWLVNHYISEGDLKQARRLLEQILAAISPLGFFAEELDPSTGEFLGNFPQAFSHLGLISAVLNLTHAEKDPDFFRKTDSEKFFSSVGATVGWKGVVAGFLRVPDTAKVFWSNAAVWPHPPAR